MKAMLHVLFEPRWKGKQVLALVTSDAGLLSASLSKSPRESDFVKD